MANALTLGFSAFAAPGKGVWLAFCDDKLKLGRQTRKALGSAADLVRRAAAADKFTGKSGSALDIVAPAGLKVARLVIIGTGKAKEWTSLDLVKLGGNAMGRIPGSATVATLFAELPGGALKAEQAVEIALG
ncbi:MAG: M17 family peptidase N-terminal domain-containing protein, partial [Nocardioidaceae bacterium]